jgi:hypothetical protein
MPLAGEIVAAALAAAGASVQVDEFGLFEDVDVAKSMYVKLCRAPPGVVRFALRSDVIGVTRGLALLESVAEALDCEYAPFVAETAALVTHWFSREFAIREILRGCWNLLDRVTAAFLTAEAPEALPLFELAADIVIALPTDDRDLGFAIAQGFCPLLQGAIMCGWQDAGRFQALLERCLAQLEAGIVLASGKTANLDRWGSGSDENVAYVEAFTAGGLAWSNPILQIFHEHTDVVLPWFEEVVLPRCELLINQEGSVGFGMDLVTAYFELPDRDVERMALFIGLLIDIGKRIIAGVSPNAFSHAVTLLQIVPLSEALVIAYRDALLEFLNSPATESTDLRLIDESAELAMCACAVVLLRGGQFLEMRAAMTDWLDVFHTPLSLIQTEFAYRLICQQITAGNPVPLDDYYVAQWLGPYLIAVRDSDLSDDILEGFAPILRHIHAAGQLLTNLPNPIMFQAYLASIGIVF